MIWVVVIVGLLLLVFVHELGHFSVALLVGMRPRSFYIGFPPAIVKVERNGIEYGIGAIPLGGLVRIPGMHRPAGRDLEAFMAPARCRSSRSSRPRCSAFAGSSTPRTSPPPARSCPSCGAAVDEATLTPGGAARRRTARSASSTRAPAPTRTGGSRPGSGSP